jgi:phenylacetate-coenzyme A ligase PaaK-like adenylate-forming protein
MTSAYALRKLLCHCHRAVPFYSERLEDIGFSPKDQEDPVKYLSRLPLLTKEEIRSNFKELQSADLGARNWFYNTSGGSTGEPINLIQDSEYDDHGGAISRFYHCLLGCDVGQHLVRLWGSERDVQQGTESPKARFFNWLTNTTWLNAFRMSPQRMRHYLEHINHRRPRLILAYAQAAYELARFAENESLPIKPQRAVLTSAGTLYSFMRQKIAQVFACEVYNLYGSREVGVVACELPGLNGLWVAPWGNIVEILDDEGLPVPPGEEGNIVVTSLTNYAMPLVRYWIGDRGALAPNPPAAGAPGIQVLKHVSGRNVDVFRTRDRTLIDGEYFTHLLYFRPWVSKFQVIQKAEDQIVFKVVKGNGGPASCEIEDITAKTRLVMGEECQVNFEFPADLPPLASGKYRYTISEVPA